MTPYDEALSELKSRPQVKRDKGFYFVDVKSEFYSLLTNLTKLVLGKKFNVTVDNLPSVQKVEVTRIPSTAVKLTANLDTSKIEKKLDSLTQVTSLNRPKETRMDRLESLMEEVLKELKSHREMMMDKPEDKSEDILGALQDLRRTPIKIANIDDMPVALPIPSFRDINGNPTQVTLTAAGTLPVAISGSDPLGEYKAQDVDDASTTKYYGFENPDGEWYILRESSNSFRYCKGTSGYTTAWTNRASQSYDYYSNVF